MLALLSVAVPGTPYEDGLFFLDIDFPIDYPFKPPKMKVTSTRRDIKRHSAPAPAPHAQRPLHSSLLLCRCVFLCVWQFTTNIYHANVNEKGGICLDSLKDKWTPALTTRSVLGEIIQLAAVPQPRQSADCWPAMHARNRINLTPGSAGFNPVLSDRTQHALLQLAIDRRSVRSASSKRCDEAVWAGWQRRSARRQRLTRLASLC